jgi:cardiolipin synthase
MTRQDIPNLLSILRIVLIIPIVWLLISEQYGYALSTFALAGFTDGLDGFLAKQYHWQSRLGTILDPIADKLLLTVSFATLTWLGLIPFWLLLLVLMRDVFIVIGGLAYHYIIGQFELTPVWSSKINTVAQILLILVVILQQYGMSELQTIVTAGIWLVTASVFISGTEYILIWGARAWQQNNKQ